jgi:PPP family 3-phenylpropionic acid transporter
MTRFKFTFPPAIAAQYFFYFGAMGVFLPYFNLYCFHIGFDGVQIGLLSSIRSITAIIFPLVWGALADRLNMKKPVFVACCFLSAASWGGFLLTADYAAMLVISVVYGIFYSPIISFMEALTVDTLGPEKQSYGKVRAWGSMSFILMVLAMGWLIDRFSISIILTAILAGSLIQALLSVRLSFGKSLPKPSYDRGMGEFLKKPVVVFLCAGFLMLVSHGGYYGFFSIHLEKAGYGSAFIGGAWALASAMEIIAMVASKSIFKSFSMEKVLCFSFFVAALRWMILYFVISPVWILLSQVLHAVTYGMFHMASILYMDSQSPDHAKTLGQSINNAVTYGMGLMAGFFLNGYVFELLGSKILFLMSSGIALAGGILFTGFVLSSRNINPLFSGKAGS